MIGVSGLSIIALTAALTGNPCEDVFENVVKQQIPFDRQLKESVYITDLANSACKTSNPDIVWQITRVETNFHFEILRFNNTNKVLKGEKAIDYLLKIEETKHPVNIDVGIMQVNWYWHRKNFENSTMHMLRPANQVDYLVNTMAPIVRRHCRRNWIGCYHNPANGPRAERYNKWINGARRSLAKASLAYINEQAAPIPPLKWQPSPLSKAEKTSFNKIAYNFSQTPLNFVENTEEQVEIPFDRKFSQKIKNTKTFIERYSQESIRFVAQDLTTIIARAIELTPPVDDSL